MCPRQTKYKEPNLCNRSKAVGTASKWDTVEEAEYIKSRTTVLTAYQLIPKGWSISRQTPDPKIAPDGMMMVGGLVWNVMEDTIKIKIPKLYFEKKGKRKHGWHQDL